MRPAPWRNEDIAEIAALEAGIMQGAWTATQLAGAYAAGNRGWTVRIGEELAAYAIVLPCGEAWELLRLGVAPAHRRQGLASRLVEEVAKQARVCGGQRILLEVRAHNEPALAFYRRVGFQEIARRRAYYARAAESEDAVIMERRIFMSES
ncbi:MAG: ribosomal protein S18-alanine N-acetyltransferase [Rhodocyclaceae bacterium]|nr:ribosomal protein S18-alanine N-acetyltransferase [Rhodocyclaceae bacterium]